MIAIRKVDTYQLSCLTRKYNHLTHNINIYNKYELWTSVYTISGFSGIGPSGLSSPAGDAGSATGPDCWARPCQKKKRRGRHRVVCSFVMDFVLQGIFVRNGSLYKRIGSDCRARPCQKRRWGLWRATDVFTGGREREGEGERERESERERGRDDTTDY